METKYRQLKTAYNNFGQEGPKSLVDSFRSFGTNEFENEGDLLGQLIRKHLINNEIFFLACEKEFVAFPDIFQLLALFPKTLRFTKQIFLHRSNPVYNELFLQLTKLSPSRILSSFCDYYQISSNEEAVNLITFCLESWFSKIDTDHIDGQKMFRQFDGIIKPLLEFKKLAALDNSKARF